jgi:hypothetical protein
VYSVEGLSSVPRNETKLATSSDEEYLRQKTLVRHVGG